MPTPMTRRALRLRFNWQSSALALLAMWALALVPVSALAQTRFSFETNGYLGVTPIVFAPDNHLLALTANGADILLFDLLGQREVTVLKHAPGDKSPVSVGRMVFSPDSRTLAMAFGGDRRDREIVFFDVQKRARRGRISVSGTASGHGFFTDGRRFAAAVNADGERLLHELRVWDSESLRLIKALDGPSCTGSIAFSRDGKWLATVHGLSDTRGQVILWDAATLERRLTLRAAGRDLQLAFSPDSRLLAAGINHHANLSRAVTGVRLWDVQTGKERGWMDGYEGARLPEVRVSPVFAPSGRLLAATCYSQPPGEEQVKVWNLSTRETRVLDHDRPGGWAYCRVDATFSPDGDLLASAANFGRLGQFGVRLWETKFWTEAALLDMSSGIAPTAPLPAKPPLEALVDNIQFSPDGKWLAARRTKLGNHKQDVFLWKVSEVVKSPPTSPGD